MANPYLAQILMFGGNFAPRGWAFCDGQLLAISSNQALFSLLGTIYGGDGRTTFALPDLRGRIPIHRGTGPGLSTYNLGQKGGTETNTLTILNMPPHNHGGGNLNVSSQAGEETAPPAGGTIGAGVSIYNEETPNTALNANSVVVNTEGGSQPVNNIEPFNTVNYIIALQGVFPSRN